MSTTTTTSDRFGADPTFADSTYAAASLTYARAADVADADYAGWAAEAAARFAHREANAETVATLDNDLAARAARSDRRNAAAMRRAVDAAAVNAAARPMLSPAAARYAAARYAYAASDHGRAAWSTYVNAADAARSL